MIKSFCPIILLFCVFTETFADNEPGITSVDIAARTLEALPNCLHYEVKGACVWLSKTGIKTATPYLSHYLPDVVISVFNKSDDNPWLEMRTTLDAAGAKAQSAMVSTLTNDTVGGGQHKFNNPLQENTFFKEADVIGNPALTALPKTPVLLSSTATPLKPYFQSMLDSALWRGFSPQADAEQAYAAGVALVRYIGTQGGMITWGTALPYEGKVETSNDAKAAAVIAQRAGNLITTTNATNWGHVYQSLSTNCGTGCTAATIQERSEDAQFQLIYPVTQNSCQVFGRTMMYGEEEEMKTQGAYLWVLWRKYEGCIQGDGELIAKT